MHKTLHIRQSLENDPSKFEDGKYVLYTYIARQRTHTQIRVLFHKRLFAHAYIFHTGYLLTSPHTNGQILI